MTVAHHLISIVAPVEKYTVVIYTDEGRYWYSFRKLSDLPDSERESQDLTLG